MRPLISCCLIFLLITSIFAAPTDQLKINELLVINTHTTLNHDKSEFPDWIELYNPTDEDIFLGDLFLSDDFKNQHKWAIPAHLMVPAHDFLVIWADGENRDEHANFKLGDSEEIGLYQADGTVIDTLDYQDQVADVSYGRMPDGSSSWGYFESPTPGTSNQSPIKVTANRCHTPQFSQFGGLFNNPLTIMLTSEDDDTIRYTTDGTWPSRQSALYSSPLNVDQSTVIRAACFSPDKLTSRTMTQTFILNKETDLPVLFLTTDPDYLFDEEIGITVGTPVSTEIGAPPPFPEDANYWNDWERPAHLAYYDESGNYGFDLDAGIKVFGGAFGVQIPQKAFSVYARDKYGIRDIDYRVFSSKSINDFKRLTLRCSSNDFNLTFIRDAMMTSLIIGRMDVDYQAYEPAIMFINGQYWGLYNIREKMNQYYAESNFGYDSDDIDLLEGSGEIGSGDDSDYQALLNFIRSSDLSDSTTYASVAQQIDVDEYINYLIAEFYFRNHDWLVNNTKWWRDGKLKTKWRWMLYDLDWGFGGEIHEGERQWETNSFEWAFNLGDPSLLLQKLLKNQTFNNTFVQRMAVHLQTTFEPERVHHFIDSLAARISFEMPIHIDRWEAPASISEWNNEINILHEFADRRPEWVMQHLQESFLLESETQLVFDNDKKDKGIVKIAGVRLNGTASLTMFSNIPFQLEAIAKSGYAFSRWEGTINSTSNPVIVTLTDTSVIRPIFIASAKPQIVINEIHYNPSPEQGPDSLFEFVELVNAGSNIINLNGYSFSRGIDLTFPEGITLQPNEYCLLVPDITSYSTCNCKRIVYQNSKLDNGGEALVLVDFCKAVMDSVRYNDNNPWPELPDGKGYSLSLKNMDLDNTLSENWIASNEINGTPGQPNQSTSIENIIQTPKTFHLLGNFPNPFNSQTQIRIELPHSSNIELTIFNVLGQKILNRTQLLDAGYQQISWNGCNHWGTPVPSGLYFYNIKYGSRVITGKMALSK